MERKNKQLEEVKWAVDNFFLCLFEKDLVPDPTALDHIRSELEDFVFDQVEGKRTSVLQEVRERIEGQLSEVER